MPGEKDTVNDESVDSTHMIKQEVETNGVVIAQLAPGGPNSLPSENPITVDGLPIVNPTVPDAPRSWFSWFFVFKCFVKSFVRQ